MIDKKVKKLKWSLVPRLWRREVYIAESMVRDPRGFNAYIRLREVRHPRTIDQNSIKLLGYRVRRLLIRPCKLRTI